MEQEIHNFGQIHNAEERDFVSSVALTNWLYIELAKIAIELRINESSDSAGRKTLGFLDSPRVQQIMYEIHTRSLKEYDLSKKLGCLLHWLERIRLAPGSNWFD